MKVAAAIGWGLFLIFAAVSFWIRRRRRAQGPPSARAPLLSVRPTGTTTPKPSEVLIWINADGSARELTEADKQYVDTEFSPFDGARPYIKSHYEQRNGWGELTGYLHRKQVPAGIAINPAPLESSAQHPTPQAVEESLLGLVRKHRPDAADKIRFRLPRSPE